MGGESMTGMQDRDQVTVVMHGAGETERDVRERAQENRPVVPTWQSPRAFYQKCMRRSDIRGILEELARR
jgi:hypothetical protein